jgi:hypothetical protein
LVLLVSLAPALALPACGGGGGGDGGGAVLFSGSAGELVPHAVGRTAAYRVTATSEGMTDVSGFTSTVTAEPGGGAFVTRFASATGAAAESTSRDTGDEVRVERFVDDPGGPDERSVALDPPVVVVRTPVVAGDAIETRFARTLELLLTIDGAVVRRQVLFTGDARRVPAAVESVTVPGGTFDAVRYDVSATGATSIPILGGAQLDVSIEVAGAEWIAPGAGGVREDLDVTLRAGGEQTQVRFVTERVPGPD